MKAQDFLRQALHSAGEYQLTLLEQQEIEKLGMVDFIVKKLTSKKFRKWSLPQDSTLKQIVEKTVNDHRSLELIFPFGGYKLWRLSVAPEADWAEFLTCSYYAEWLAPIAAAYAPGVNFVFSSDDIIIERMDNIPMADTQTYFNTFSQVLDAFAQYLPSNLKMSIVRVTDLYEKTQEEFEQELAALLEKEKVAQRRYSPEVKKKLFTMSELNIQWDGKEDWTKLSDEEKQHKIELGAAYHHSYINLTRRVAFVKNPDKVVVFATHIPIPNIIAVGTTKASVTKFWTGMGVLERKGDGFLARVLSPQQLESGSNNYQEEKIEVIDLKNFKTIRVY